MDGGCEPLESSAFDMSCQTEEGGDAYEDIDFTTTTATAATATSPTMGLGLASGKPQRASPYDLRYLGGGGGSRQPFSELGRVDAGSNTDGEGDDDEEDEEEEEDEDEDPSDGEDPLSDEEDWCLEQIEMAYAHLKRGTAGQLAQYEMRRGLEEAREVYRRLSKELGETPQDTPAEVWEAKPTREALSDYRPLLTGVLGLRGTRETQVVALCKQCAAFLSQTGAPMDSPVLTDIQAVASHTPKEPRVEPQRRKTRRGGAPPPQSRPQRVPLLPRGLGVVSVHSKCIGMLETLCSRLGDATAHRSSAPERRVAADGDIADPNNAWDHHHHHHTSLAPTGDGGPEGDCGGGANTECDGEFTILPDYGTGGCGAAARCSPWEGVGGGGGGEEEEEEEEELPGMLQHQHTTHGDPERSGPVFDIKTPACVTLFWEQHIDPTVKRLGLSRSSWAGRMRDVMGSGAAPGCDAEEVAMAARILVAARENLLEAEERHEELTTMLKTVMQDIATFECLVELRKPRRGPASRAGGAPTAKQQNEAQEQQNMRRKIHGLAKLARMKLSSFAQATQGVPYVPPAILTSLLGLPSGTPELQAYLSELCESHRCEQPQLQNASASL